MDAHEIDVLEQLLFLERIASDGQNLPDKQTFERRNQTRILPRSLVPDIKRALQRSPQSIRTITESRLNDMPVRDFDLSRDAPSLQDGIQSRIHSTPSESLSIDLEKAQSTLESLQSDGAFVDFMGSVEELADELVEEAEEDLLDEELIDEKDEPEQRLDPMTNWMLEHSDHDFILRSDER